MKERYVLCDASSLISLTSACLENTISFFHDNFGVRFLVPQSVEYEAITRPLSMESKIHRFSALRIKGLINDGALEVVPETLKKETKEMMELGNSIFYARGTPVRIIQLGETEMLVLAKRLQIDSLLMDERTTRFLVEDPLRLQKHLEKEFRTNIMVNKKALSDFSSRTRGLEVMRSTELLYLAYEQGFLDNFEGMEANAAEAAMYTLKYAGCAVSFRELKEYSGMMEWEKP